MSKIPRNATLAALLLLFLLFASCMERDLNNPFDPANGLVKPATPVFDPPGGNYYSPQTVSITCATSGATIRYTTDGSEPSTTSTRYTSSITLSANATLKAKGFKSGWNESATATADYGFTVANPTFNPPAGNYTTSQSVTLACTTSGASIRYTTNGNDPTASSTIYTGAITVDTSTTIKAKGFRDGWNDSATATAVYTMMPTVATPTFDPPGETYSSTQTVTISCSTSGATIRFTLNGTEPTSSSYLYSNPLNVTGNVTIKAKGFKIGWDDSTTATAVYTIIPIVATPTFAPPGGFYYSTQTVSIYCSTSGATIRYTTDYTEPTSSSTIFSSPLFVSEPVTIKAKGFKSGWFDSTTAMATYTFVGSDHVSAPTFNPPGGTYSSVQSVTISCSTSGATIRYTTNGTEPTTSSPVYSSPVTISSTTILKAKGFKSGWISSPTVTAVYIIDSPPPGF